MRRVLSRRFRPSKNPPCQWWVTRRGSEEQAADVLFVQVQAILRIEEVVHIFQEREIAGEGLHDFLSGVIVRRGRGGGGVGGVGAVLRRLGSELPRPGEEQGHGGHGKGGTQGRSEQPVEPGPPGLSGRAFRLDDSHDSARKVGGWRDLAGAVEQCPHRIAGMIVGAFGIGWGRVGHARRENPGERRGLR